MAGIFFAHGCAFTWGGVRLSHVRTFEFRGGEGEVHEVTNVTSRVVGTGEESRVVKVYDTLSVEPVTLLLTFYGPPPASGTLETLAGSRGKLDFVIPNGTATPWSYTSTATLKDWSWSCQEIARPQEGSASFLLGGW